MIKATPTKRPASSVRSIYFFIERNIKTIAGLVIGLLLMKVLSLKEYGTYNLFLGSLFYLGFMSSIGVMTSYTKLIPETLYKNGFAKLRWLVNFTACFRALGLLVAIPACYYIWEKQPIFFDFGEYSNHFLLFAIGAFFLLQSFVFKKVLEFAYLQKYLITTDLVFTLSKLGLIVFVLFGGYGFREVLLVDLVCNFGLFCLLFLSYVTNFSSSEAHNGQEGEFPKSKLVRGLFQENKTYSLNEAGSALLSYSTDFFIIAYFLGPIALGYYAFSVRISEFISQLFPFKKVRNMITPTLMARFTESNDKKEINHLFQILLKISLFCLLPIITVITIWGENIIANIIDAKFLNAYETMVILLLYTLISTLPFSLPLQIMEKSKAIIIGKLILFGNILLSIAFVQLLGFMGAAIAALTTILLKKGYEFIMARKHASISLPWMGLGQIFINCLILGVIAFLAKPYITGLLTFAFFSALLAGGYLALSKLNNAFHQQESRLLKQATLVANYVI